MRRVVRVGAVLLALLLTLCGCGGPTFSSLPLPGGGVSGPTIDVRADFAEALNLADGAAVRVDGVPSGRVVAVAVHDFHARVTLRLQQAAHVRRGATARLRYTTPLGELFVDLSNPATGRLLADGAVLPLSATSTAPTVEDALASTSLLINGGGLAQLQTITTEANTALGGREREVRDVIERSNVLLRRLNHSTGDIDRALRALADVSGVLAARRAVLHRALADVRPAARSVRANLHQLTALLTSLRRFGGTANTLVGHTRVQALRLVRRAQPLLEELVSVRAVLPQTLEAIVQLSRIVHRVAPGDYLNLGTHLHVDGLVLGGRSYGPPRLPGASR